MNDTVLITGASGFTGAYVVREFLKAGNRVRAMVRSQEKGHLLKAEGAEIVLADLSEPESLKAAVEGVDGIVHIAALFRQAGLPESEFFRVNVEGTRALLDYAVEYKVKRFVHCSTVGVHGHIKAPPADEASPFSPGDMYQRSKLEGELLVQSYLDRGVLSGVIIRPAMIYGPHDARTRKLFSMISKRRFFYVGKGDSSVHFIDVRDLARAFLLAFERSDLTAKTFIIAGREAMPLRELVNRIALIVNVPIPRIHLPVRPVQILGSFCEAICTPLRLNPPIYRRRVDFFTKTRCFDTKKACQDLGFSPSKGSYEELIDIVNSYVEDGVIEASRLSLPCRIGRTKRGVIYSWDNQAEAAYGWGAPDALGRVSHELFRTEFPAPLELIDKRVDSWGEWIGNLRHQTCAGRSISVLSRWSLSEKEGERAVEEENRIRVMPSFMNGVPYLGQRAVACAPLVYDFAVEALQVLTEAGMPALPFA